MEREEPSEEVVALNVRRKDVDLGRGKLDLLSPDQGCLQLDETRMVTFYLAYEDAAQVVQSGTVQIGARDTQRNPQATARRVPGWSSL